MLKHKGTVTLNTKRLVLRKFQVGDEEAMYHNWCSDARVAKYTTWYAHQSIEDTRGFLKYLLEQNTYDNSYNWGIELEGQLIGNINVCMIDEAVGLCGIGYCLAYDYWGKGITTEACRAVVDFLFNEVGCHKVIASHDCANVGSGKVMKKVGMKHEGSLKEQVLRKDGSYGDHELYGILKKDYERNW